MIKSFIKFKSVSSSLLLVIFVFAIFFYNNNDIQYIKNVKAEDSCKNPADVILVVDRSATMANGSKFAPTKSACNSFIDSLFATTPDIGYSPYDYHQIGLVAFNNNINSEQLNQNGDYMKGVINDYNGILGEGSGYPSGYRRTSIAIQEAQQKLDPDLGFTNPSATRTMIVLTDGPPHYDLNLAKTNADIAKSNGVRVVSVGLKLDEITDPTKKAEAEDFIKYIASTPSDCYYTSDSGNELADCTSISGADLEAALAEVYNNITASICDDSPPVLNIYRTPQGTLYDVDELLFRSVASDNVGFKSHNLIWSDNWPNDLVDIECTSLSGAVIECDTGALGPFSSGEILNYRSVAVDANDNEGCIEEPDPRGVTVAAVTLNVPSLLRNTDNTISVSIFDPSGKADFDSFFITIDAPALGGVEIEEIMMTCTGTGSNRICSYDFNPDCDWRDGITGGAADNLSVNIYIYADSNDMYLRQIASAENQTLTSYFEGASWAGTCSDGINNDCDYTGGDPNQPIIDLAEMSCDTEDPLISISRVPSGNIYDDDTIAFTSTATDTNGIRQHTIYYREDGGVWQTAFDCNDADADSDCDEDPSQNIGSIQATIGAFTAGVEIEYYSTAIDYSGGGNSGSTAIESFIVRNVECDGVGDLGACNVTPGGKCCGEVCNVAISNPNSYNIASCAMETCNGASWEWGPNSGNDGAVCVDGSDSDGCYTYGGFWDGGCEERVYACSSGHCLYNTSNRHGDYCVSASSLFLNDYECVGNSCLLDPDPSIENGICDMELDHLSVNARDNENNLIVDEVLDSKTEAPNNVSLTASVNDVSGIEEYKIYWQEDGGGWQSKDCGSCGDGITCDCIQKIGPFAFGETVDYYARARDNSVNHTEEIERYANGLRYHYYNGTNFNTYLGSDIDTNINHTWGSGQISINGNSWENQSSTVSIIWEGLVAPNVLGVHTFYLYGDDGLRFDVDGNRLIDHWSYSGSEYSATYDFTSLDPVAIRIEWYENYGAATLRLGWEEPGGTKTYPIPSGNLFLPYSFTVYDHECYDVPGGNKPDLTVCGAANEGKCCGGSCDLSPGSTSYDEGCYTDACSGTDWVYDPDNEGNSCGAAGTCFDYYTGCMSGNKCASGLCSPDQSGVLVDFCVNNLFTDYECSGAPGNCEIVNADVDCSSDGDDDGDGIDCDCDCDSHDIEEKVYSSLSFDGTDDYVVVNPMNDFPTTELSVEFWMKSSDSSKDGTPISYAIGSQSNEFMFFNYRNFRIYIKGSSVTTGISANDGNWHHIVATWESSTGQVKLYKDGDAQIYSGTLQQGATITQGGSLAFGQEQDAIGEGFDLTQAFLGSLDEVRVYSRVLYPEEIKDHYNGVFLESDIDLEGYWSLDEGSGKVASDSSGNGYDGALSNTDGEVFDGSNWTTGRYGDGISLDGNDYVNIPLSMGNPSAMSLETWFFVEESNKNRCQYIMDGRGGGNWWFLQSYNPYGSGNINFYNRVQISTDDWDADQWNHLVMSVNSAESKIYINGELKATGSGRDPDIGANMKIGTRYTNSGYFMGKFDETRVYNRVLSEGDVLDHYNNNFADEIGLLGHWNFDEGSGAIAYDSSENSPQWEKYHYGSASGVNGSVPVNWQVCTDSKDNDCDGYTDNYDGGDAISSCDGEVDGVSVVAGAEDRDGVPNNDLFGAGFDLTIYDIDIERISNDFTITANAVDDFLIQQITIEWTTDNWINKDSKSCNDSGTCEVCVAGGTCGEGNDLILSSSLSAGNTFDFRVCAWDNSANNNKECTEYYSITILSSNMAPEITPLSFQEPDFCDGDLGYILRWNFSDADGDGQLFYEIQVKEGDNNFEDTVNLIINSTDDDKKYLADSYYQILSGDFVNSNVMEYNKTYYWRVKVTDDRGGGYEQSTDWTEGPSFDTPEYRYPQVDFDTVPDYTVPTCVFDIGYNYTGGEPRCNFGENIAFSDISVFVECDNSDDSQCVASDKSRCSITTNLCSACTGNPECTKFGAGYWCDGGICSPPTEFACATDDDCKMADKAKCDLETCVLCDDDSQCSSVVSGYVCHRNGKCEDPEQRKWYFYSNDGGVPDSNSSSPVNNYIESIVDSYIITLRVKDIFGNSCSEKKNILLGGAKYPKWNEMPPSN